MMYRDAVPLFATAAAMAVIVTLAAPPSARAQPVDPPPSTAELTVLVVDSNGEPATDAEVQVSDLRRRATVDSAGRVTFTSLPIGGYMVEAVSDRGGRGVGWVRLEAGRASEVEIVVQKHVHGSEIVVTGSATARSRLDLAQATGVLTGDDLSLRLQPSLGETLSQEPGVNSTFFGPGASRPVIRGLGGDRVRMLQDGLGTGDVSATSPDHAVSIDPGAADRIEILRGPATLLYGSSAIGGVVNVIDDTIPSVRPEGFAGMAEVRGGTGADERYGLLELSGGSGRWAWHLDGNLRETGDYEIPGRADVAGLDEAAEAGHSEEEITGVVPNSDIESRSGAAGLSWIGERGSLGISFGAFDTEFGIPGGHAHEEGGDAGEGEAEEAIRQDLQRRRFDLRGEITEPFGVFSGLRTRLGIVDYEHRELEGDAVGTVFLRDSVEGRFELVQRQRGSLSGSFGLQVRDQDLEAIGDEAFIPPSQTTSVGLFTFQEIARDDWRFQFGGRFETTDNSADDRPDRSFDSLSASVGVVRQLPGSWSLAASLARSAKAPNTEELYSDGPHIATQAFEIGDPDLGEETSLGLDVSLRRGEGRLSGELSFFVNRFDDFIYQAFTGGSQDGLPVLQFVQDDAEFVGAELDSRVELWQGGEGQHLHLRVTGDWVRAELADTGEPLPRIPPLRLGAGFHYHGPRWQGMAEVRWVDGQDRLAENETPTDSYTMVNASLGYRIFTKAQVVDLLLRGTNLTDEEARNHVSFLKDRVPLPGRDVTLSARVVF